MNRYHGYIDQSTDGLSLEERIKKSSEVKATERELTLALRRVAELSHQLDQLKAAEKTEGKPLNGFRVPTTESLILNSIPNNQTIMPSERSSSGRPRLSNGILATQQDTSSSSSVTSPSYVASERILLSTSPGASIRIRDGSLSSEIFDDSKSPMIPSPGDQPAKSSTGVQMMSRFAPRPYGTSPIISGRYSAARGIGAASVKPGQAPCDSNGTQGSSESQISENQVFSNGISKGVPSSIRLTVQHETSSKNLDNSASKNMATIFSNSSSPLNIGSNSSQARNMGKPTDTGSAGINRDTLASSIAEGSLKRLSSEPKTVSVSRMLPMNRQSLDSSQVSRLCEKSSLGNSGSKTLYSTLCSTVASGNGIASKSQIVSTAGTNVVRPLSTTAQSSQSHNLQFSQSAAQSSTGLNTTAGIIVTSKSAATVTAAAMGKTAAENVASGKIIPAAAAENAVIAPELKTTTNAIGKIATVVPAVTSTSRTLANATLTSGTIIKETGKAQVNSKPAVVSVPATLTTFVRSATIAPTVTFPSKTITTTKIAPTNAQKITTTIAPTIEAVASTCRTAITTTTTDSLSGSISSPRTQSLTDKAKLLRAGKTGSVDSSTGGSSQKVIRLTSVNLLSQPAFDTSTNGKQETSPLVSNGITGKPPIVEAKSQNLSNNVIISSKAENKTQNSIVTAEKPPKVDVKSEDLSNIPSRKSPNDLILDQSINSATGITNSRPASELNSNNLVNKKSGNTNANQTVNETRSNMSAERNRFFRSSSETGKTQAELDVKHFKETEIDCVNKLDITDNKLCVSLNRLTANQRHSISEATSEAPSILAPPTGSKYNGLSEVIPVRKRSASPHPAKYSSEKSSEVSGTSNQMTLIASNHSDSKLHPATTSRTSTNTDQSIIKEKDTQNSGVLIEDQAAQELTTKSLYSSNENGMNSDSKQSVDTSANSLDSALSYLLKSSTPSNGKTSSSDLPVPPSPKCSYRYAPRSAIANAYRKKLSSVGGESYSSSIAKLYGSTDGNSADLFTTATTATISNSTSLPASLSNSGVSPATNQSSLKFNSTSGVAEDGQKGKDSRQSLAGDRTTVRCNAPQPIRRVFSSPSPPGGSSPRQVSHSHSLTDFDDDDDSLDFIAHRTIEPATSPTVATTLTKSLTFDAATARDQMGRTMTMTSSASVGGVTSILRKQKSEGGTGVGRSRRRVTFESVSLLLSAAMEGELDVVRDTIGSLSDPSTSNCEGVTALHNAVCGGHTDTIRYLIQQGSDVNAADDDGWTPLHCAATCNNLEVMRLLVQNGACILATSRDTGETPALKCARHLPGYEDCVQYLTEVEQMLGIAQDREVYTVTNYASSRPDELSFCRGERIKVLRRGDKQETEWWWGRKCSTGEEGYVPRNLLALYSTVNVALSKNGT